MKIKFKKDFLIKSGTIKAGVEFDLADALAKSYIKRGYAVVADSQQKPKAKSQKPKAKSQKMVAKK